MKNYMSAEHRFVRCVSAIEKLITSSDVPTREELYDTVRAYVERVFRHLSSDAQMRFLARFETLSGEATEYALGEMRRVAPSAQVTVGEYCFRVYFITGGEPEQLDAPQMATHEICVCYLTLDRPTVRKAVTAARRYCVCSERTFWREIRRIRQAVTAKQLKEYERTLDLFDGVFLPDGSGGSFLLTGAIVRFLLLLGAGAS